MWLINTYNDSTRHNRVYARNSTATDRRATRNELYRQLIVLGKRYRNAVSETAHVTNIEQLAANITNACGPVLHDGRFRIGTAQKALNMFLKYLWTGGWIPAPPHCPILSQLTEIPKRWSAWTAMDSIEGYKHWVRGAKAAAGVQLLPWWELHTYGPSVLPQPEQPDDATP